MSEPSVPTPDRVVSRVNDLATSLLDVLATLLLGAAAGYGAWQAWGLAWGLFCAGLAVMVLSAYAQGRAHPKPVKHVAPRRSKVPGPSDSGTLHIAGGE